MSYQMWKIYKTVIFIESSNYINYIQIEMGLEDTST